MTGGRVAELFIGVVPLRWIGDRRARALLLIAGEAIARGMFLLRHYVRPKGKAKAPQEEA